MKPFFLLVTSCMMAMGSVSVQAEDTIRFGTEASVPPFESVNDKNEIVGFDIDLAKAICAEIKAKCTFTNQSFDSLIPSLRFKRLDAVIASMDITPERKQQVAFTDSYFDNAASFVAIKDKFSNQEALQGKKVGVQNGTTHQKYLQDTQKNINTKAYDSYQSAVLDLKSGRIDAIFADNVVAQEWLKQDKEMTQIGDLIKDPDYFGAGLGIALRKEEKERLEKFNAALKTLHENGTYETIYKRWF